MGTQKWIKYTKYKNLEVLLNDAEDAKVSWRFDEQQADPVHRNWTWNEARSELAQLLHPPKICDGCGGAIYGTGIVENCGYPICECAPKT